MPQDLKAAFYKIRDEVIQLHYRWTLYKQLFATNTHRVDIINKTAPNVLVEFDALIIDYMILSFSRLTDPASSGKNENLGLPFLFKCIDSNDQNEPLTNELKSVLESLEDTCDIFRKIRHKRLAHNDSKTLLRSDELPIPGISIDHIEKTLLLVSKFMNKIQSNLFDSNTAYENLIISHSSDGRALIIHLQKSLAYDQLVKENVIEKSMWEKFGDIDSKQTT